MKGKNNKLNNPIFSIENISKNILPYYNLQPSNITMIKFKDTDKHRVVYKIDSKDKSYCLKKVYYPKEELLFIYSALEWLYKYELNVSKLIPTIHNGRFVEYKNMLFILTPWINGEKCDFDNIDHILFSAIELAKLHKSTENFTPINGSLNKEALNDNYISTLKHFEDLLKISGIASNQKDLFSKKFLSSFNYNQELAEISLKISSLIENDELSISLCHGDYVNKNIIFTPDNKLYLIDFDKCCIDYSAHDIAYFLRRLLKRDNTKWNFDLALTFLERYNSIRHLTTSDIKYILSYLSFPQKYYKLSKDYYNKKLNKSDAIKIISKVNRSTINQLDFIHNFIDRMKIINWNLDKIN